MSVECMSERFQKLRDLRQKLCSKEKNWQEAFEARDWLVDQLKILMQMNEDPNTTREDVGERIADLLCIFEPDPDRSSHDK